MPKAQEPICPEVEDRALYQDASEAPPDHVPLALSDEHYQAIGRVAVAWSDLEFEIDRFIWRLTQGEQGIVACITAQIINIHARINALQSLIYTLKIKEETQKILKLWSGKVVGLNELRNRAIHDKRMIYAQTKEVARFQVTARTYLEFSPRPEYIHELEQLRQRIYHAIQDYIVVRDTILDELNASPHRQTVPIARIATIPVLRPSPLPPNK